VESATDLTDRSASATLEVDLAARWEDGRGPVPDQMTSKTTARATESGGLRITKVPFDWNEVDYATIYEPVVERLERICEERVLGAFYLNAQVTVYSRVPSITFVEKARICRAAWCRRFAKVIGPAEFRRQARRRSFWERQFGYYGIMLINGKLIPPHDWDRILPH